MYGGGDQAGSLRKPRKVTQRMNRERVQHSQSLQTGNGPHAPDGAAGTCDQILPSRRFCAGLPVLPSAQNARAMTVSQHHSATGHAERLVMAAPCVPGYSLNGLNDLVPPSWPREQNGSPSYADLSF